MKEILNSNPLVKLDQSLAAHSDLSGPPNERSVSEARKSLRKIESELYRSYITGGRIPRYNERNARFYYSLATSHWLRQDLNSHRFSETTHETEPSGNFGGGLRHFDRGGYFLVMMQAIGVEDRVDTGLCERIIWKPHLWDKSRMVGSIDGFSTIVQGIEGFRNFEGLGSNLNEIRFFSSTFGISFESNPLTNGNKKERRDTNANTPIFLPFSPRP